MTEHDHELEQALAENGTFDAEKGRTIAADAIAQFHTRLQKTERLTWFYLVACLAVMVFAMLAFRSASSVKTMIGLGILLLVAYETSVLIKLWYWTVNTKLALLKAVKQLQWQLATGRAPTDTSLTETATGMRQPGLSLGERLAWIVVLVLAGVASSYYSGWAAHIWPSDMVRFEGAPVTIEAPRVGAPVYYRLYLRMDRGQCKVSRVTPDRVESELFRMGKGFVSPGRLSPGDTLRLDPQGNPGEYWVRFE